jgi:hypothetical protein
MPDLPGLDAASLERSLDLREEWLAHLYTASLTTGPGELNRSFQTSLWDRVRELHRLRLVFLGTPCPGLEQWAHAVVRQANADPAAWEERRRRSTMMSMEFPGDNIRPVEAEPADRVTGQYRAALAFLSKDPGGPEAGN